MLFAGALTAATYFTRDDPEERELRDLADALYRRADWSWAQHGTAKISLGWKPRSGFLKHYWSGYDESLLLQILALGSPPHAIDEASYATWTESYRWENVHGQRYLYAGPLFIHQLPSYWLDLRGIQDAFMRTKGIDYFENSRRATLAQQRYAIQNEHNWKQYGEYVWGLTACEGPGPQTMKVEGVKRRFYDYVARGVPHGPDDGTIAPWVCVGSLPFAPEIVLPTIHHYCGDLGLRDKNPYGFKTTFNPTFPSGDEKAGWVAPYHVGLNHGPIVLAIENYRNGMVWELMRNCRYVVDGLRKAGFRGGWLEAGKASEQAPVNEAAE